MVKQEITSELRELITYIEKTIYPEYTCETVDSPFFILAIIDNENSEAAKMLYKNLMDSQIQEIKESCYQTLSLKPKSIKNKFNLNIFLSDEILNIINSDYAATEINSLMILGCLLKVDEFTKKTFKSYGLTYNRIKNEIAEKIKNSSVKKTKKNTKKVTQELTPTNTSLVKVPKTEYNEVERYAINVNRLALEGKIENIIGNEGILNSIFRILSKKHNNNVIVVGDNGVGKTATVKHIANLIISGQSPKSFFDKVLVELDYKQLLSGTMMRGAFESRIKSIVDDAKKNSKYIFLIDNVDVLADASPNDESNVNMLLETLIDDDKILLVCVASEKGYNGLVSDNQFIRKLNKIDFEEPDEKRVLEILDRMKEKFEIYHDVRYSKSSLTTAISLSKKYFTNKKLPAIALDLLDETAAAANLVEKKNTALDELNSQLNDVYVEKDSINKKNVKDYDKIDELTKKEIKIKALISSVEKSEKLNKKPLPITDKDIKQLVCEKVNLPFKEINKTEKDRLKNINDELKKIVIGQDKAVDEVCKVVKRQRVGMAKPNKPSVFLFVGGTGQGKTFLAKKLAEKIFGNEKYLVRMDMSEYSDKMSVAKLVGSSAGYVGYGDTPLLFQAYNKMKEFVLLLDECEKADETVFNTFLQVFDEGRLTSGRGETIDLRNIIIIMTSNVGVQEANERGGGIGFNSNTNLNSNTESIIRRAIKRQFKPEFINRIDNIIFFKNLSDNSLRIIIKNEINRVEERVKNLGFSLSEEVYDTLIDKIMLNISDKKEYGARPILREIENELENKITDILIEKNIKKGHKFTSNEIFGV